MHKIESWDMCRALARRGRRALQRPFHGGVAVAAAWAALEAAGRVARPGRLQREATGGGGAPGRRVGDSARRINGRDGRESAVGGRRRETEQGVEVEEKGDFAISKNPRD